MKKGVIGFIFGLIAGVAAVMAYLHRDAISACVKGEAMPEIPESCPFSKTDCSCDISDIEE